MRSVACTGGVHAGTETGVVGTAVDDCDDAEPAVVLDDEEPFELQATTSTRDNDVRTTATRRPRFDQKSSDISPNSIQQKSLPQAHASAPCLLRYTEAHRGRSHASAPCSEQVRQRPMCERHRHQVMHLV